MPSGYDANLLAPALKTFGLIAQVGSGTPFLAGVGPTTTAGPGELALGFNDSIATNCGAALACFKDNAGGYTATITTYTPVT